AALGGPPRRHLGPSPPRRGAASPLGPRLPHPRATRAPRRPRARRRPTHRRRHHRLVADTLSTLLPVHVTGFGSICWLVSVMMGIGILTLAPARALQCVKFFCTGYL